MDHYEKFKLQWMADHGYTIEDLVRELDDARQDHHPQAPLMEVFEDWEMNSGFGGEIWPCENEWADCEGSMQEEEMDQALPEETFSDKKYVSPQEALVRSLSEKGKADMSYMTLLTGMEEEEICKALSRTIYPVPGPANEDGFCEYVTAGEYLSGTTDVLKRRLLDAIDAAEMSSAFDENVKALQKTICGMCFSPNRAKIQSIRDLGGEIDQYGIPHFTEAVFNRLQYAGESTTCQGEKALVINYGKGPRLIIEGKHFVIDKERKE